MAGRSGATTTSAMQLLSRNGESESTLKGQLSKWIPAAVLFTAAALKAQQLATDAALGVLYGSKIVTLMAAEGEVVLAIWLLIGLWPQICRRVAITTFTAFSCYALYSFVSGSRSCGCFGQIRVHPQWTLVLDLALVATLWRWNASPDSTVKQSAILTRPRRIAVAVIMLGSIAILAATIVIASRSQNVLATDLDSMTKRNVIVLEPDKWIGNDFPLTNFIDIGPRLLKGSWIIVLYHHDCPKCQAELQKYSDIALLPVNLNNNVQIAIVEVPPYGSAGSASDIVGEYGRLSASKQWIVTTPAVIRLESGRVITASAVN
jgi:hypothetical protein